MENPNFVKWSREEKDEYAKRRLDEMRIKNKKLEKRHAEVQGDRIKAENENCSVTNLNRRQERVPEGPRSRLPSRYVLNSTREWDRGKNMNDDWGSHSHKGFKNYKTGCYEKTNKRNDSWQKEEKYYHRSTFDKTYKKNQYQANKCHYENYHKSGKYTEHQSSYSYVKTQQPHELSKGYYRSDSRKKNNKHQSSSSDSSGRVENKEKQITKTSSIWTSDKLQDKIDNIDKNERTKKWVDSVYNSSLDQDNASGEENKKSPKRKCMESETDKPLTEKKSTKFDRYRSNESSDDSYDLSRWCSIPRRHNKEVTCTLSSIKQDSNEKEKNDMKTEKKTSMKFVKTLKSKRDPQYNSLDGCNKYKQFTKQRKFNKLENNSVTQPRNDHGDRDLNTNEDCDRSNERDENEKETADCCDNLKNAEKLKGQTSTVYDEGGWSTVEEGEIRSDDSEENSELDKTKINKKAC